MPGLLLDTNVWVGLTFRAHPLHAAAHAALAGATAQRKALFCRSTQQSYLRLASSETLARHYGVNPISNREAFGLLEAFMARPDVGFADEPPDLLPRWKTYADLPTPRRSAGWTRTSRRSPSRRG